MSAQTPTPWLVIADGEGSADTRICRTHAEIVQFLWEQCGHDHTGDEEHARNAWFAYLEDGDNWQSRDGAPQFRCDIEVGETGHINIQWMGAACNQHAQLVVQNERLRERIAELEPAAECWDALAACYRITCMGSAGLLEPMAATGYAHATFNLWTIRGEPPKGATGDAQDVQGRIRLAQFLEIAIANKRTALALSLPQPEKQS